MAMEILSTTKTEAKIMLTHEKKELLTQLVPKAVLKALTSKAKHAILKKTANEELIPIFEFPFKMGRETRVSYIDGEIIIQERHKLSGNEPSNDVYLFDNGQFLQISREHCSIAKRTDGYILQDRGSACGSMVNETKIGGDDNSAEFVLHDGDIITLGSPESEYKFKFILLDVEYN
jgi:hypothetical protein